MRDSTRSKILMSFSQPLQRMTIQEISVASGVSMRTLYRRLPEMVRDTMLIKERMKYRPPRIVYMDSLNGSDANDGSIERPYRTLSKASDGLLGGDQVRVAIK